MATPLSVNCPEFVVYSKRRTLIWMYAGSMKGDQKLDLAAECFSLGLRTLSFVYGFIEKHLEGLIEFFLERLEPDDVEKLTVDDLLTEAKRHVFLVTHWWAILMLKRLSHSAGSAELYRFSPSTGDRKPFLHDVCRPRNS
jgi:hypothetical protein